MTARVYQTASEEETIALGRELALELKPPATVLLIGNLGAGKTTVAKGIVAGLGVAGEDDVTSPTYTLIHEYGANVYHIDLYRLDTAREAASLGIDELLDRPAILLVEWGERFPRIFPRDCIEIRMEIKENHRVIEVTMPHPRSQSLVL